MSHEEIRLDIAAYLAHRLTETESSRVDAHLATCDECEELVSSLRGLGEAAARHGDALFDRHPGSGDLARFSRGESGGDSDPIQRHIAVCAACQLELDAMASPSAPADWRTKPPAVVAPPLWARAVKTASLLAAGLVAGLLLHPLLDRSRQTWNGPIDLPILDNATRSDDAITRIMAMPGQAALVIAVPFDPPAGRPDNEMHQLQVLRSNGAAVYTLSEPLGRLKRHADSSDIIPLMIQSELLPPGSYRVTLTGSSGPQDTLAVFRFEVVTAGRPDD